MATLKELRDERLRKLSEIKMLGINPFPATTHRTHKNSQVHVDFESLQGHEVTVAGRIIGIRKFGKIAFIVIRDDSGQLQLFLKSGIMMDLDTDKGYLGMPQLPLLDSGDFIEASGVVIKTQTGEESVEVRSLRLLTKSLRPLPTEQEGFTNKEERLRRRYVDTNANPDVYQRFLRRSAFWKACRDYLLQEGFTEINIPVLEQTTGGADANPFVTHMDALGQDFYLRISHELPLKRLLVAGYEKVFDVGPRFRNENYSDEHLPEHVAIEWYWAYADWRQGMELTQRWVRYIADKTWGRRTFVLLNGQKVDLGSDDQNWPRISFVDLIKDKYDIDVFHTSIEEVSAKLREHKIEVEKSDSIPRGIDKLWKKIRVELSGPAFLIDIPTFLQPLAKTQKDNPLLTEQFNLILGGTEACKAYSELNDPIDQLNRFTEQQAMRDAGDDEAMMMDIDYVEALEYAMPPACGYGHSERLFWMLEGVTAREGVPFPQLRYEIDETTKSIYNHVNLAPKVSSTTKTDVSSLPISAAVQGTAKLYLEDFSLFSCDAEIMEVSELEDGSRRVVVDRTCVYPGGGGQDYDLGTITWDGGLLTLTKASKNDEGLVYHDGLITGASPTLGTRVRIIIDEERRFINSRLHCAGHLLDYALKIIGKDWRSGKSAHYPHMSFVDYTGTYDPSDAETIARDIEVVLADAVSRGGPIGVMSVPSNEAKKYSEYIPDAILDKYQNVHIATYPDNFNICCGGTHLRDVRQVGKVEITKIKKKDGSIRVSYKVA